MQNVKTRTSQQQKQITTENCIDDYVTKRINFTAMRMQKKLGLTFCQLEDIKQQMAMEVCKSVKNYEPCKTKWYTFVNGILSNHYKRIVRDFTRRQQHSCLTPFLIPRLKDSKIDLIDSHDDIGDLEIRIDVEEIISTLPYSLRRICELLKIYSKSETAKKLNVSQSCISYAVKKIRKHFEAKNWRKF